MPSKFNQSYLGKGGIVTEGTEAKHLLKTPRKPEPIKLLPKGTRRRSLGRNQT